MHTFQVKGRTRLALTALAIGLALGVSACQGNTNVTTSTAESTGITVTGRGEINTPPDIGFITVGVNSTATTVAEARDKAATAIAAVIEAIKKDGVDAKDIQTTGLSIQANYDYTKTTTNPQITGYTVTNTVATRVRKLETMSDVIDNAVEAGGDDVRLQGIRFGIDDETKAKEDARASAMADAKVKAEQLAKLGGVTLGSPVTISEIPVYESQGIADADAAARSSTLATPIETGTNLVSVEVTVRYSLR